jgi:hypothetical protein
MSVQLESVRGELRRYGRNQVRVELASVFICDRRDEALEIIRSVASLGAGRPSPPDR